MAEMRTSRPAWRPSSALRLSAALHVAAVATTLLVPRWWRWAAAAMVANHLYICAHCLSPRSRALGPTLTRLPDPDEHQGAVALTIDDGPDPEVTPQVLDVLDAHGAKASFFLIGTRAARHPALVEEIGRRGHTVENHTHRHLNSFAVRTPSDQAREIDRAQDVLTQLSGRPPAYFRPPAGIRSPLLDWFVQRRGLTLASWTRRGFDTADPNARRVARRLTRGLQGGDVLLLHDGNVARGPTGRPVVLDVLPLVLSTLEARGLRAVTLPRPPMIDR